MKLRSRYTPLLIFITVISMISVPISYQKTYRKPNCPPVQHADIQTDVQTVKKYPQFAIGVKTGKDVALTRPLIQLLTFLKDVKNIKFFAEVPGIMIGDYEAIDVVSKLAKRDKTEVFVDGESEGWKKDADKNIPALMYLFENVDAEWYFLIDDDTYMFLENIQEYLLTLDHNEAHYLGNPNSFVGCDGVTQFGQGPQFAHGGSGIILSRGALEKMKSVASECIQKYSSCWAGDIRLALCLRDVNVFVQGTGRNHINPPNDLHFWGSPCDKPFTFHHLTVPQIQKLYQSDQRNQVTRNQDIVPLFLEQKLEMNVDRKGYDYYNFEVIEPQSCFEKCAEDEHCVAFTHANKRCYLKDKIPDASDVEGFVSGPLISHYKCT